MPHLVSELIKSHDDFLTFDVNAVMECVRGGDLIPPDEIARIFNLSRALYIHSGLLPHVKLTSGKHSDKYYDCPLVLQWTKLIQILAAQLIWQLENGGHFDLGRPTVVIGSPYSDITFSFEVARQLGCRHIFTEKGPGKTKELNRYQIYCYDRLLMIEELITTLSTAEAQEAAIKATNPIAFTLMPVLGVLVNRSGLSTFGSFFVNGPIVSVLDTSINPELAPSVWDPEDCPLCQAGSPLEENPKKNWDKLFAKRSFSDT